MIFSGLRNKQSMKNIKIDSPKSSRRSCGLPSRRAQSASSTGAAARAPHQGTQQRNTPPPTTVTPCAPTPHTNTTHTCARTPYHHTSLHSRYYRPTRHHQLTSLSSTFWHFIIRIRICQKDLVQSSKLAQNLR